MNIDLPYDPTIPLLGIYPRIVMQVTTEAPEHPCCSTMHNNQVMVTTKMPHYRHFDQENVVFTHNGILLSHEEE
jgi:hypothetical protein